MSTGTVVYTIPQVAERLGISKSSVYRLIDDGQLEAVHVRSKYRVRHSALERFLDDATRRRREGQVTFQ